MKESEARIRAERAFQEGMRLLVLDVTTNLFRHRDEELTALLNAIESEGWELKQVFQDPNSGATRGLFRRAEAHRTLR